LTKAKGAKSAAEPVDEASDAAPAASSSPTPPAAWEHVRESGTERAVRGAGMAIALLLFAVAAIIALYNAMRVASIWFESRYVPIVQFLLASAVMFGCYAALRRLTKR
jgi:hypothetical protein